MNAKIKKMWVAALRSGQYKQTTTQLRKGDAFCCLGVLCNIHAQEHPDIARTQPVSYSYLDEEAFLPLEVQKWAGVDTEVGGVVEIGGVSQFLTAHNDDCRTFRQIADAIEAQL